MRILAPWMDRWTARSTGYVGTANVNRCGGPKGSDSAHWTRIYPTGTELYSRAIISDRDACYAIKAPKQGNVPTTLLSLTLYLYGLEL